MDKQVIITSLRRQLKEQYERIVAAIEGSHEASTGSDNKAEGKYDTRALEASYLASGQAEQADEIARSLAAVDAFEFPDFEFDDSIEQGALIECERDDELVYFLLAPGGGGLVCSDDENEITVTVIGPEAPLREKLIGKSSGDSTESPDLMILEVM